MPADPPVPTPGGPHLRELMSLVRAARGDVEILRAGRVDPALLFAARGVLLDALERYAEELVRLRLPMPPGLRDELRLQRGIRERHNGRGYLTGVELRGRGLPPSGAQRR